MGGRLGRRLPAALRALPAVTPIFLSASRSLLLVVAAQTVMALGLAALGVHVGRLLHDAVSSRIRAGVCSGAGTLSWLLFLPFSLGLGALARREGVQTAGWLLVGASAVLAVLVVVVVRPPRTAPDPDPSDAARADTAASPPVVTAGRRPADRHPHPGIPRRRFAQPHRVCAVGTLGPGRRSADDGL